MKDKVTNILSRLYRSFTLFINHCVPAGELEQMAQKQSFEYANPTGMDKLKLEAFKPEFVQYVNDKDSVFFSKNTEPEFVYDVSQKYLEEFEAILEEVTYEPGGMINSQLLLLYSMVREYKPELFIESGTKNGYSAQFIARAIHKNETGNLVCLSLFEGDEYQKASEKLAPYPCAKIIEGFSQESIKQFSSEEYNKRVGILIDGPKARSEAWDELVQYCSNTFKNIEFFFTDSGHEHLPYYSDVKGEYPYKRGINRERMKFLEIFKKIFGSQNYGLSIQSNRYCEQYNYLNDKAFSYRNERWGKSFPWKPYAVDRIANHVALCYKLGFIYNKKTIK